MAGRKEIPRELSIYVNDVQVVNSMAGITREIAKTNNEIKNLNKNSETYNEDLKRLKDNLGGLKTKQEDFKNEIGNTNTALKNTGGLLGNVASGILTAFSVTAVVSGFVSVMKGAYETTKKFEQGVADLSAITGATGKDLDYLKNSAIDLGAKTKGGAIAVVEAYKLIASAKPELLENVQALNQVTEAAIILAQAAGMELPDAATNLTDAMNQFGADADQATKFIDALANGAKYGAAEIPQTTDALLKFGAVARSSNINIKESVGLVELLAENGLKGADAGTALRNVLLKLSAPDALPKEAVAEMTKLGISLDYLKDKTIPIQEKLETLKPLLKDNASIVKVFGVENATAAINILAHSDRLKDLTSKMGEVGTAEEQAAIKMNTLQGKTEQLSSTYDSFILSIGKGSGVVSDFFKFFVDGASNSLKGLIRLNSSWDELNNKARQDGQSSGQKMYQDQFNSLIGENLTDEQRKKIHNRLAEIREEIKKGSKDAGLKSEQTSLLEMIGTGSETEVSKSIATTARRNAVQFAKELKEVSEKLNKVDPYAIKLFNTKPSPRDLKVEKERLIKALSEQNAIIEEHNKKVTGLKTGKLIADDESSTKIDTPKDKKTEDKATKDSHDRAIALAKAKMDLAKAELDNFITNNQSKLENETKLNKEIVQDEVNRMLAIKNTQQNELLEDRKRKTEKAKLETKSEEEFIAEKKAIDLNYETEKQKLELKFSKETKILKEKLEKQDAQFELEKLKAQNDLEVTLAKNKFDREAKIRKQAYDKEKKEYADKLAKNLITDKQYAAAILVLDKQVKAQEKQAEMQKVQGVLQNMSLVANALGQMFGQSKELAIVQANISGAQAVLSIWQAPASMPQPYDAILKGILTLGVVANTASQIQQINSQKPPKTPQFYDGGHTGTNPYMGTDEYGAVTGVVHANEWVAPAVMTQNPRYAATIAWLENERKGVFGKPMAAGGETTSGSLPVFSNATPTVDNEMKEILKLLQTTLAGGIKSSVNIGYKDAKEIQKLNTERENSNKYGTLNQ